MEEAIGAGCARAVMRRKRPHWQTTAKQRQTFLDELAISCNVRRAAAVAGIAASTPYKIRRRDPLFAEQWQAALCEGYVLLETLLVQMAIETAGRGATAEAEVEVESGADVAPDVAPDVAEAGAGAADPPSSGGLTGPAMTIPQAIDLLNKHRASVAGGRAKTVRLRQAQRPTAEETDDYILRKIAVIERQRATLPRKADDRETR